MCVTRQYVCNKTVFVRQDSMCATRRYVCDKIGAGICTELAPGAYVIPTNANESINSLCYTHQGLADAADDASVEADIDGGGDVDCGARGEGVYGLGVGGAGEELCLDEEHEDLVVRIQMQKVQTVAVSNRIDLGQLLHLDPTHHAEEEQQTAFGC